MTIDETSAALGYNTASLFVKLATDRPEAEPYIFAIKPASRAEDLEEVVALLQLHLDTIIGEGTTTSFLHPDGTISFVHMSDGQPTVGSARVYTRWSQ